MDGTRFAEVLSSGVDVKAESSAFGRSTSRLSLIEGAYTACMPHKKPRHGKAQSVGGHKRFQICIADASNFK